MSAAAMPITEEEIATLVDRFYVKVRVDPEIGPVFNNAVQNWDAHLALLKDFWSTVLGHGSIQRQSAPGTLSLPIQERYFARWLMLFSETAKGVMTAGHAEVVAQKADLIAMNMKRVLAFPNDASADRH